MTAERILILIPHPDDEIVGCAAAIVRARAGGAIVHGVYLTNGVPDRSVLWPWDRAGHPARVARRWWEAEAAAAALGIEQAGRLDIPTRTLKSHLDEAGRIVDAALARTDAQEVWVPAYEGAHQDHDTANYLASRLTGRAAVQEFAEYNFAGGTVRSQTFFDTRGGEAVLTLSERERTEKRALLALYASERGNLRHIEMVQESFRPLPRHDYMRPPHPGRQFYQRFQWVPIHPRIDRCKPEEVSAAIAEHAEKAG